MTDIIAQLLQQILESVTSVEGKLDSVLEKVQRLETALRGVQSSTIALQSKATQMKKTKDVMDAGLNNLNIEVQELREKIGGNENKIKLSNDRCLYQEVYNRRENLRFLGIPESTSTEEDTSTSKVIYQFVERELELNGARDIQFQRVHRIGITKNWVTFASNFYIAQILPHNLQKYGDFFREDKNLTKLYDAFFRC